MSAPINPLSNASPIYTKAQDIFTLSRSIASYLIDDISAMTDHDMEDPAFYYSGDIVQQSVSLAPEILKAEQQTFQEDRYKSVASLNKLTASLYKNCERLEKTKTNGKDFLPLLMKEIKKFRRLQRNWMLTL